MSCFFVLLTEGLDRIMIRFVKVYRHRLKHLCVKEGNMKAPELTMHEINKPATFFQEDLKFPLLGANRHLRLQCGGRFDSSFNFFLFLSLSCFRVRKRPNLE